MLRISACSLIIYIILGSCGTLKRVATEELPTNLNEDRTGDTSFNQGQETGRSQDVHILLQEPHSQIVNTELVASTPTSNQHTSTLAAVGADVPVATQPEVEAADIVEPTVPSVGLSSQSIQVNALPQPAAQQSDVHTDQVEQDHSQGVVLENRPVSLNGDTVISTGADQVLSAATDTEPVTASYLPDIQQVMEHTPLDASDSGSHYLPSSEGNVLTIDVPVPTQSLKGNSPGTWEPTAVGKVTVNPQLVDEALLATQFSLEQDDEKHNNGEEEFPTFDKWSLQYLAQQEKQNSENKQDQVVSASSLLLQKKLRQNYAATSCGAKVLASNPEAENVQYLLNRNPDEYMISPCKAKKWFVVELCEPLQIHKLELGSLEMFSSPPKSFRVFASQRYPTKEWLPVGKYDMVPERSIQSFSCQPSTEFVKFVRVELLEHYGDEHYCPVSTFRVMGVDMTSDDDDETVNEVEEADEETFGETEDEDVEESVNLFTSAKEMVMKLVNKVLYKDDQQNGDEGKEDKTAAADNITVEAEKMQAKDASCSDQGLPSYAKMPTVHIPEAGIISPPPDSNEPEEMAIVTKLADSEQLPTVTIETPVVIKLGEEVDGRHWDWAVYSMPDHCVHVDWSKFLHIMAYSHMSTTCPARSQAVREVKKWSPVTDEVSEEVTAAQAGVFEHGEVWQETVAGVSSQTEDRSSPGIQHLQLRGFSQIDGEPQPVSSSETDVQVLPTTDFQHKDCDEAMQASESTSLTWSAVSVTRCQELEPSSLLTHPDVDSVTLSLMTPDLELHQTQVVEQGATNLAETIFLKVSPSPTLTSEDSMGPDEDIQPEAPTADQRTNIHVGEHMSKPPSDSSLTQGSEAHAESQDLDGVAEETKGQILEKNETSSSSGKMGKSVDLVKVGLSSASKRDTSIIKLSSRIMALEQNVSMAKKYLEELSRAFKQQNEDMMRLFNKTEKKLNVFVSQSEERELRQQTQADVLEQQVVNLSQLVDTMQLQMNALGKELRHAQFLLAFVQAVLFLWLIVTSVRGRSKSPLVYTDHQFLLDTMPTKPTIERSEKGNLHRRNSDLGAKSGLQSNMSALKRQVSEANLASLGVHKQPHCDQTFVPDTSQVPKRRKKKKLKQHQLSVDSVSSLSATSTSGILPAQSASFSSYAGVLFGTVSSYTAAQNNHVGEPSAQNSHVYEPYTAQNSHVGEPSAGSIQGKNSTAQTLNSLTENTNWHSTCELQPERLGWPCVHVTSHCLHTSVRTETIGSPFMAPSFHSVPSSVSSPQNITNSSLVSLPLHSVRNSSLISPSLHSVIVPSEPVFESGTDKIVSFQLRQKLQACDVPATDVTLAVLSRSPEFYEKKRLLDNKYSTHCDAVTRIDQVMPYTSCLKPQVGPEFGLPQTGLCDSHLKLPLLQSHTITKTTHADRPASQGKHAVTVPCQLKQHSCTPSHHYSCTSALSSHASSTGKYSCESLPHTLSLIPLHDTSNSTAHNPQSLSHLSTTCLLTDHKQPTQPTYLLTNHKQLTGATPMQPTGATPTQPTFLLTDHKHPTQPTSAMPTQPTYLLTNLKQPTGATPTQPTYLLTNHKQPTGATPMQPTSATPTQPTSATSTQPTCLLANHKQTTQPTGATPAQPNGATPKQPTYLLTDHKQPTNATPTQPNGAPPIHDGRAVLSHETQACQNVTKFDVSSVMTEAACVAVGERIHKPAGSNHTHRRQRWLPLHSPRPTKTCDKIAHVQPHS